MKLTTASYLLGLSSVFFQSVNAEEQVVLIPLTKKWGSKTPEQIKNTAWSEVKFRTNLNDPKPFDKSEMVEYNHANNPNKKLCRNIDSWKVSHKEGKVQEVFSPNSVVPNAWEAYPGVTSEVAIECRATWNDDDATFTYLGESDVLTKKREIAVNNTNVVEDPQDSYNFRDHCFGRWQVNKCMDVEVTYEFTITNTYTIPQAIFYDKRKKQNLQVTVKNSTDTDTFNNYTFNNYGSLLDDIHSDFIQPNQTKRISPRVGGFNSKKKTFTINTCDEIGMNFVDFRIKMTLGIFCNYEDGTCNHGNNGNLANRCGTADSISFELEDTIPIITEIARPVINNVVVNHVVEIYAPSITNNSKNYYFVWIDGSKNMHKQILLNEPNNDGYFVFCQTMEDEVCTHQLSDLSFTGSSSFWITDCESTTTTAEDCTKVDTVNDEVIEGKIYRLHNVGDSDKPSGNSIVRKYWVIVNSSSPQILTPGTRDEFGLIITEVTDPSDKKNQFIELFSPTGQTHQQIPPVLDLYLIIYGGSEPQRLPLDNKELDENGFVVISIPTDPLSELSGNSVVRIETCEDGEGFGNCTVLDVYGVPGNAAGTPDFTGGRAYRLPGPAHDMPKSTWDSDDWVIVKPLDGEDTTPGNRDDFELIITEVTDPTDEGKKLIELFSPTGHTNHPIKENLFLKRYDNGTSPVKESLPLKGKVIDSKGFIVVCKADGTGCDLRDSVADLSGKNVVTIERCSDESGTTDCVIVDVFGLLGNAADTPDFTGGRAYRLPGPVHDMPKSTWDSKDWVILGNVDEDGTTPGNRDDFKLIITEVTDPADDENKFIELFSPYHANESIPSNYHVVRYIDGKHDSSSPKEIHVIGSKGLKSGYYIVPVSSNDDIKDLDGDDVITIEKCVEDVCDVVDVYGIPNHSSDDLIKHDFTDGRAYRLQGPVHDTPKNEWDRRDWVIVKPLDGEDTTPGNRDDFKLIITEVTDPKDDKKRFVELYSPSGHINYSIMENLYLKRYDGESGSPSESFDLKDKFVNNNGFIVICASNEGGICQYTDDVAGLDGDDVITIEKCVEDVCDVVDVYGIPNHSSDDLKKHDFTDGRAYRLQGPVHDTPKGIWDRRDWVIVKPLDGEDTTPGDRDDFNLIITEVTDKDDFIELHSTNVHNNYPFPDNYFVVKYTGGRLSSPAPTVFPLKDEILDDKSFFVICGAKSSNTYCNASNIVGDLDGGDVVTIEKCVGDKYSSGSCDIVDVYGIPGTPSTTHNFYNTRAYRKRGNVHDVAKSTYDSDDWVIAEIGNASTPGNRDDDNCPVANTCSDGEIGIWLSDDDFSCCKPNPLCGNVCEDTYCSCSVEGKNEFGILNNEKKCVEVKDAISTGPSPPTPLPAPGTVTCEHQNQFCSEKCSDEPCDECGEVGVLSTGEACCRYASNNLKLCPYPECIPNAFCNDVCAGEKCPGLDQGGTSPSSPGKGGKGAPPAKVGKGVSPSKKTTRLRRVRK